MAENARAGFCRSVREEIKIKSKSDRTEKVAPLSLSPKGGEGISPDLLRHGEDRVGTEDAASAQGVGVRHRDGIGCGVGELNV